MLTGISSACLYPMQTEEAVETILKLNPEMSIEIFINSMSELSPRYIKELKSKIDFYGGKIASVHPFSSAIEPLFFFSNYKRRFDDAIKMYEKYFKTCVKLDSNIFVFHGDSNKGSIEDEIYFERYSLLREMGKKYGITVAQENVERCKSRAVSFISKMKRQLDGEVSFVFDVKQAIRAGVDPFEMISAMGDSIIHVHASDNNEKCDCLPVGKGTFDFNKMLTTLKNQGFDKYIILELYRKNFNTTDDLKKGYLALNNFVKCYWQKFHNFFAFYYKSIVC